VTVFLTGRRQVVTLFVTRCTPVADVGAVRSVQDLHATRVGAKVAEWDPVAAWQPVVDDEIGSVCPVYEPVINECPVVHVDQVMGGFWGVFGYGELVQAALDTKTFSNQVQLYGVRRPPLESDPPEHTGYRRMMNRFFAASEMEKIEPTIRAFTRQMLDELVAEGNADFAEKFAFPFPTRVLCAFMRIPDRDWVMINDWSSNIERVAGLLEPGHPKRRAAAEPILPYLDQLVDERRHNLGDDVVSGLIGAEINGRALDNAEIIALVLLLVSAGHNTTTSGIGNLVLRLARDQQLQTYLREHTDRIADAVEETIRIDAPQQAMRRRAVKDTVLAGQPIKAGEYVWMGFGAANVDERTWTDPGKFDIDRANKRRHVGFGRGIHQCIGAPLARLEMRIVTEELFARTGSFEVSGEVTRRAWPRMGVASMPLHFAPRS
jgi:cytochrome P450